MKQLARRCGVHSKGTFGVTDLIEGVKRNSSFHKVGGLALFIGVVRGETDEEAQVRKLELQAYNEKADETLERICSDLSAREGIVDVQIHHLLGEFGVGEELVYVLVAGAHRSDLFPTLQKAVERYKKEVPIFKKEYVVDSGKTKSYWINEGRDNTVCETDAQKKT